MIDAPFLLRIGDVYTIAGRGTVVTGPIEHGIVRVNDEVEIVGLRPTIKTEAFTRPWLGLESLS